MVFNILNFENMFKVNVLDILFVSVDNKLPFLEIKNKWPTS